MAYLEIRLITFSWPSLDIVLVPHAYHKWSNPNLTLDDYRVILSCHVAQSNCFNQMVEGKRKYLFQKIFKKIQMMPDVTFLSYHMKTNYWCAL